MSFHLPASLKIRQSIVTNPLSFSTFSSLRELRETGFTEATSLSMGEKSDEFAPAVSSRSGELQFSK
jgi:hypothetical protein